MCEDSQKRAKSCDQNHGLILQNHQQNVSYRFYFKFVPYHSIKQKNPKRYRLGFGDKFCQTDFYGVIKPKYFLT